MNENNIITVTSPLLPNLEDFNHMLEKIWANKWITNMGEFHQELEKKLAEYLGVEYISLFTNGTLPLITALQALGITKGEVITTPYSFVATSHAIWWNGLKPVFVDVDPNTGNIDPTKIEAAITEETVAILPVHVYGCPCDVEKIDGIARKYNLKVIYDAAHAFGVKLSNINHHQSAINQPLISSVLKYGDISTLSFHATKVFNTIEGGALVCHSKEMKEKIDHLKNFGFEDEVTVVAPGINSKMDEMRAAYGLLNLKQVDQAIAARKEVARKYVEALKDVKGIKLFDYEIEQTTTHYTLHTTHFSWNFAYFPILITEDYPISRDKLYAKMKVANVLGRRYFYPLITEFDPYKDYSSAAKENLPVANKIADSVICLPMHHQLSDEDIKRVLECIIR